MTSSGFRLYALVLIFMTAIVVSSFADEGMWLYNAPPLKQWKEK